jgi:PAS domain S-box-containing protein
MSQIEDLLDVLSRIKDSVVALDNCCTITYVNQAFADVMRYKPSEMIGKNIWQLLPESVETPVYKNIHEAMESKETRRFEWRGVYAISHWETTIYPSAKGVTIITTDVTKHHKALESLRSSEENYKHLLEHVSGLGSRAGHDGRQNTPVVVMPA